jgi:hypothetical protein
MRIERLACLCSNFSSIRYQREDLLSTMPLVALRMGSLTWAESRPLLFHRRTAVESQACQELPPGKDLDTLAETGGALVANEDGVARMVVLDEGTE